MQTKDLAICLRTVNYSETSQVVTLLTRENGKTPAMAKGSRRAKSSFDGPIEIFSYGQVIFSRKESGGQLAALTDFEQQPRFRGLHANLHALNAALFATELTEHFLEDADPHPVLFDKFTKFLETLQDSKEETAMMGWLILYQLRLLEEIGLCPELQACVNCSTGFLSDWKSIYFSSHSNGLLCPSCETAFVEKRAISTPQLALLQNPSRLPKAKIEQLHEIEQLLIYHFTELLGKPPRMAKYYT